MSKKTIAEIVIVIVAFLASGVVLYRGLVVKDPAEYLPQSVAPAKVQEPTIQLSTVFPFGERFDIDTVLAKRKLQFGVVQYPKLDPNSEVGVPVSQLVPTASSTQP